MFLDIFKRTVYQARLPSSSDVHEPQSFSAGTYNLLSIIFYGDFFKIAFLPPKTDSLTRFLCLFGDVIFPSSRLSFLCRSLKLMMEPRLPVADGEF